MSTVWSTAWVWSLFSKPAGKTVRSPPGSRVVPVDRPPVGVDQQGAPAPVGLVEGLPGQRAERAQQREEGDDPEDPEARAEQAAEQPGAA